MADEQDQRPTAEEEYLTNPFGLLSTSGDLEVVKGDTDDEPEETE
jgi:hypothetical protein